MWRVSAARENSCSDDETGDAKRTVGLPPAVLQYNECATRAPRRCGFGVVKMRNVSLPYIDNARAALLTALINLGVVFLFFYPGGVTYQGVLLDSLVCAVITTIVDLCIVFPRLSKLRAAGLLPAQVPVSRLMQRLPKNPFALGAVFAALFAALTIGVNALILWFFGQASMAFVPWMTYKLVYSTVLSTKITEFCIFRYVQPDWAETKQGVAAEEKNVRPVKDPLPRVSTFKAMYGSVTGNIAMQMISGLVFGSAVFLTDGLVAIAPARVEGMPITGLIFGFILGMLTTRGVVKSVNAAILAPGVEVPESAVTEKAFAWMPKSGGGLSALATACVMLFSAVALRILMTLLGLSVLNIYQFAVFITVYANIISKPLSHVLVRRCMQPDYARHVLQKAKNRA